MPMAIADRLRLAGLALSVLVVSGLVTGQAGAQPRPTASAGYPDRVVRMIVPAAAGSGPDALGRLLATHLAEQWGKAVIVENVLGAGGIVGHERGARATADGHTMLMGLIGPMSVSASLDARMPFDPLRDLAPVTLLVTLPNILVVHPAIPVASLDALIRYARQNPGKVRYAHPGSGTALHLAYEQLKLMAGVDIQGIAYKASTQMTTDIVGGHIETMFHNASIVLPLVRSGALRAIAITSAQRIAAAADIPTMAEAGLPGHEVSAWYAMYVPAATPKALVARLNTDLARALGEPAVKDWMSRQAGVTGGGTPEEMAAFQATETAKWKRLVTQANIKAD